jgi:ABC-2 type transport system ATP-binding protein
MSGLSQVVQACELNLSYGKKRTIRDVSFAIPEGAVVGIVGRNGAGKTTLLQCLLGLARPDTGVATIFGVQAHALTDPVKARLGYVAQAPELFEWLRVRQQLELYEALYPTWSKAYAQKLTQRFELNLKARTRDLSVGERQRLAIVLALAHRPDLLILDEPVASLDPLSRRDFLRTLFDEDADRERERTVLLSSHLLEDLERVVSHVLFMREGQIQLYASVEEIESHLRVAQSPERINAETGVLHQALLPDGLWQTVIDTRRATPASVACANDARPLGISELFMALNQ